MPTPRVLIEARETQSMRRRIAERTERKSYANEFGSTARELIEQSLVAAFFPHIAAAECRRELALRERKRRGIHERLLLRRLFGIAAERSRRTGQFLRACERRS